MKSKLMIVTIAGLLLLVFAACTPLNPNTVLSDGTMEGTIGEEAADSDSSETMDDEAMDDEAMSEDAMADDGSAIATVATRSLRVREEPSTESEVVAGAREGESYKVLSISDDGQWVQIATDRSESGNGWVAANLVSINGAVSGSAEGLVLVPTPQGEEESSDSAPTVEPTPVPAPEPGFASVNTDGTRLRVRTEPNTDAEIVGYIYLGETYEVLGGSDDGSWVQLAGSSDADSENPDGGWVSSEFLVIGE